MRLGRNRRPSSAPKPAPVDGEREEARLVTALLAGDVPPVWYRQRMTALAGERAELDADADADDAPDLPHDGGGWDV